MTIVHITPETLKDLLHSNPTLQVLDVRTPEEFQYLGHLPEATLIPFHELPYAFRILNREEPVVLICQHGVRSLDACYFLEAQGFDHLYNLEAGMAAWDGPVERRTLPKPENMDMEYLRKHAL